MVGWFGAVNARARASALSGLGNPELRHLFLALHLELAAGCEGVGEGCELGDQFGVARGIEISWSANFSLSLSNACALRFR